MTLRFVPDRFARVAAQIISTLARNRPTYSSLFSRPIAVAAASRRLLRSLNFPMAGGDRTKPNILVTGTPGTGKTTTCSLLADATKLHHINVGDLVRTKSLHDGWDDEFECHIINEDLVCDEMEDMMDEGGNIVDYHGCDFFPERWFDRVIVLQTDNSILHDRLTSRGYMGAKLTNNIECEIFQVLLEEAKASYPEEIVLALPSNCVEDISRNVALLTEWANNWRPEASS